MALQRQIQDEIEAEELKRKNALLEEQAKINAERSEFRAGLLDVSSYSLCTLITCIGEEKVSSSANGSQASRIGKTTGGSGCNCETNAIRRAHCKLGSMICY